MTDSETKEYPPGDYAIVELFGHTTLVGRIAEVERFGTKMLAIEPLFRGEFLGVILHGGAAIYRLTSCSAEVAWRKQATDDWQFPLSIRSVLPRALLDAPIPRETMDAEIVADDEPRPFDDEPDELPF